MKLWTQILILTILDFIIISIIFKQGDPDPSVSIGILLVVPAAIIINLIIAAILFVIKRQFVKAFLINSIIAGVIIYYLFTNAIDQHQARHYDAWQFIQSDTTFELLLSKQDTTFYMTYSTNPGSSTSFISGHFIRNNDNYNLTNDSIRMMIRNEFLYRFRNKSDSIKLTKIKL